MFRKPETKEGEGETAVGLSLGAPADTYFLEFRRRFRVSKVADENGKHIEMCPFGSWQKKGAVGTPSQV